MNEPGYSLRRDYLLWTLVGLLLGLSALHPAAVLNYPRLVDWQTIATLAGLLLLTAGIEASGFLHRLAWRITGFIHDERRLAFFLLGMSALLAAVLTNDIALFIVVPLTLSLGQLAVLPLRRLIIFEALAVNAGSMLTPIGNPQNIFLWQASGAHFFGFMGVMLPPTLISLACLTLFTFVGFRPQPVELQDGQGRNEVRWPLFALSAALFVPFIICADLHQAAWGLAVVASLFLLTSRLVLRALDWPLLLVFVLMFVDLRLVAGLPWVARLVDVVDLKQPLSLYLAGAGLSQFISNVPATILLSSYTGDWRVLAWSVDMGGFGLAIGSLASLIALRLGRQRGGFLAFHAWSVPFLLLAGGLTGLWLLVK